jgi:hypothetical protein
MLNLDSSQPSIEIVPVRDPTTLEVTAFSEKETVRGEASSSFLLTRRLAPRADFVYGSNIGIPFLPGGLDRPASAPDAVMPSSTVVDFSSNLLSTPPGFVNGLDLGPALGAGAPAPAPAHAIPTPTPLGTGVVLALGDLLEGADMLGDAHDDDVVAGSSATLSSAQVCWLCASLTRRAPRLRRATGSRRCWPRLVQRRGPQLGWLRCVRPVHAEGF